MQTAAGPYKLHKVSILSNAFHIHFIFRVGYRSGPCGRQLTGLRGVALASSDAWAVPHRERRPAALLWDEDDPGREHCEAHPSRQRIRVWR